MANDQATVTKGHVVMFNYTLKDSGGQVLDESKGEPMAYLHGYGNIVPGLEQALEGLTVGTSKHVEVPPELGYGTRDDAAYERVPKSEFPPDMELAPGMPVHARLPDGSTQVLWVDGLDTDDVIITMNHPLAGRSLHFDVEITGVRVANPIELAHGHPHGPGGAHHH